MCVKVIFAAHGYIRSEQNDKWLHGQRTYLPSAHPIHGCRKDKHPCSGSSLYRCWKGKEKAIEKWKRCWRGKEKAIEKWKRCWRGKEKAIEKWKRCWRGKEKGIEKLPDFRTFETGRHNPMKTYQTHKTTKPGGLSASTNIRPMQKYSPIRRQAPMQLW